MKRPKSVQTAIWEPNTDLVEYNVKIPIDLNEIRIKP